MIDIPLQSNNYYFLLIYNITTMFFKATKNNTIPSPIKSQPQNLKQFQKEQPKTDNKRLNKNSHLMNILADVMRTIMDENRNSWSENPIKNADNQNNDFNEEADQYISTNKNCQIVIISNQNSIQKSKFGQKYRESLDPRDQMLAHPFKFILEIASSQIRGENGKSSFMKSNGYHTLCKNIEEYLVDVVENVVSVSFNLLIGEKLKQNQSKDYASKNILLNVRSIFKQIMETLGKQSIIDEKQNKKLRYALCEFMDNTLKKVIDNLSAYYPQAPPTGGTPRMREALLSIDRNYNEQLDFLYTQNLKLTREESGDYTEYIMKVVNKAIQVTGEVDPKDPLQQTLFEKFVAFSQHLFWVAQDDSYNDIIHNLGKDPAIDEEFEYKSQRFSSIDKQSEVKTIHHKDQFQHFDFSQTPQVNRECTFFGNSKTDQNNIMNQTVFTKMKKSVINSKNQNQKQMISDFMHKTVFAQFSNAVLIPETNKQKTINKMKKRHDFAIGQKIPGGVKPFSKKDLMDKNFSAKNSAVLRILTKWAENLENIFDNPQAFTTNRIYPFKTLNHEIVYPKKELKQILCKQITDRRQRKQKIKQYLITRNKVFQSAFFARDSSQNLSKFIKRYTETRIIASKMNALLIQFMKEYVSSLINILVEAGKTSLTTEEDSYSMVKQYDINLVVFKIGDLMRSKIHCSETTFVRLLKTLYIMEETSDRQNQKALFQLVRIKNKLDSRDNNILINYLFMGKIQCELQMSVQKTAGKELNYYSFSHFLYELSRGEFGVLAQCATIISQYDPIISSSSSDHYYEPKKCKKRTKFIKRNQEAKDLKNTTVKVSHIKNIIKEQVLYTKLNIKQEKGTNKIFVCKKCDNLKFDENMEFLKRNDEEKQICNQCIVDTCNQATEKIIQKGNISPHEQHRAQRILQDENIANWIIQNLNNQQIVKLTNYQDLSIQASKCLVFLINPKKNELQFNLFNKQKSQNIFYISKITKDLWEKDVLKEENVLYQNITQKIKKSVNMPEYTYLVPISSTAACANVVQKIKFIKCEQALQKLQAVNAKCQQKILKEIILNIVRNKNQSLQFNSNIKKMELMNKLFGKKGNNSLSRSKWIEQSLNYIQFIFAEQMNIQILPNWINMCQKTQLLNLSDNKIQDLSPLENMLEIKELILKKNQITEINWKKFIYLQRLNVSDNNLQRFSMQNLPQSLLQIDIGDNYIKDLNCQILPPFLKKIDCYGNQLTTLNLKYVPQSLQYLDFSYNNLQQIEYLKLPSIKIFFLDNNHLTSFKCQNMPCLLQFIINQNKLQNFQIKNCPSLKQLDISGTNLRKLSVIDFPALTELCIHQNSLLTWLQLRELPSIHLIDMSSLIPHNFIHLQVQNINQERVVIAGQPQILYFLKEKYPNINFEQIDSEYDNSFSLASYEDFSNRQ